jgi:D-Tyr-tRNAtyr deacylase
MPIWEHYDVNVETQVSIKNDKGEIISQFTTYGEAKSGSNESVDVPLVRAVDQAVLQARRSADRMTYAARKNRRSDLGYTDGN